MSYKQYSNQKKKSGTKLQIADSTIVAEQLYIKFIYGT